MTLLLEKVAAEEEVDLNCGAKNIGPNCVTVIRGVPIPVQELQIFGELWFQAEAVLCEDVADQVIEVSLDVATPPLRERLDIDFAF
jgi:hypothetical protein